jgi:hypothetical protein
VRTGPPGLGRLFKIPPLSLILIHGNVTWTCDLQAWFSFIYIYIDITLPFYNYTTDLRVSVLSLSVVLFFGRLPFALFDSSKELFLSSPFLQ